MDKEPTRKSVIDIFIRKCFEMKLKPGSEIKAMCLDESAFFKGMFFIKGTKWYRINISTKKINECDLTKGNDIVYTVSNSNNDSWICVWKNGKIFAIKQNKSILLFKNWTITHLLGNKKDPNFNHLHIFANSALDKVVIITDIFIVMWYKNNFTVSKNEINGTYYNISKETEIMKLGFNQHKKENKMVNETVTAVFSNDFFLGSHARIFYIMTVTSPNNWYSKLYWIDYLFLFDYNNKYRSVPVKYTMPKQNKSKGSSKNNDENDEEFFNVDLFNTEEIEELNDIKTKNLNLTITLNATEQASSLFSQKQLIIAKANNYGNILAICLNYQNIKNTTIIFYFCETLKIISKKLYTLITDKMGKSFEISTIDWWCNDMFLIIQMSNGTFVFLNISFEVWQIIDNSNCVLPDDFYYTPMFYHINSIKNKGDDKTKLLVSKQRDDLFIIYSNLYAICFQVNYKSYENRLISMDIPAENFILFWFELNYYQLYLSNSELDVGMDTDWSMSVFDVIHKYFYSMLPSTKSKKSVGKDGPSDSNYNSNTVHTNSQIMTWTTKEANKKGEKSVKENNNIEINPAVKSETVNNLMRTFIRYLRIFNNINQVHEVNLTLTTYWISRSHDFFIYLLNHKEIWLALQFLQMSEKYFSNELKLKNVKPRQKAYNNLSQSLFNPVAVDNYSFFSYKYPNNKLVFCRMRLILIFFCWIEFRNNFALNINVLYFVLGKVIVDKLKKEDLLDDLLDSSRIIVKNYKYWKQENDKIGKDEFILNSWSISYRNEIFSQLQITKNERDDINFDFFSEFYTIDEFSSFVETSDNYCKLEETSWLSDYNYWNNIGVLQKWTIFFTNYLYSELFNDIRTYWDNHLKQIHAKGKNEENTSPEERTLSKLIYFNINFFLIMIQNNIKQFLNEMTLKDKSCDEGAQFISESKEILNNFGKTNLSFISPIDIPFMIFEFYIQETNPNTKTLPYEINTNLSTLIKQRSKMFNINWGDSFDFMEFLISSGFKYETDMNINNLSLSEISTDTSIPPFKNIQRYIYTGLWFYLFIAHKLNLTHIYEIDLNMILNTIDSFDYGEKKEIYEYIFVTINGQLRHYLQIEVHQKINNNEGKYLEIILNFIKLIFYKILREEPYQVRENISDFVKITPNVMKSYLWEGALYYEYKNMNKVSKSNIYNFSLFQDWSIINGINADCGKNMFEMIFKKTKEEENKILTGINTTEEVERYLTKERNKNTVLQKSKEVEVSKWLFNNSPPEEIKNFKIALKNVLNLCLIANNEMIFSIETDKKYIWKTINENLINKEYPRGDGSNKTNQEDSTSCLYGVIDKIIKGNFENKVHFKFSNNELKIKLIRSIKHVICKFWNVLNIWSIKYKLLSIHPQKEQLNYIKYISLLAFYETNLTSAFDTYKKIVDYLGALQFKNIKSDSDQSNILSILKNLLFLSLKYKSTEDMNKKLIVIESKLKESWNDVYSKYDKFKHVEYFAIVSLNSKFVDIKSHNLTNFIVSLFNDNYFDNLYIVYGQIKEYIISLNSLNKSQNIIPLNMARRKYIKLSNVFYNITGMPSKSFINFFTNWELVQNEELYNFITTDEFDDSTPASQTAKAANRNDLWMNRRQKSGEETPRKNRKINFDREKGKRPSSKGKRKRDDSLDIRAERTENKKWNGIKTKNKIPKYMNIASIKTNAIKNENEQIEMFIGKISKGIRLNLYRRIKEFEKVIKDNMKVYSIAKEESECKVEVIIVKEKFNKEVQDGIGAIQKPQPLFAAIKPMNWISLNKIKVTKTNMFTMTKKFGGEKAKEKEKEGGENGGAIKSKLDELSEQLKKYENMANNWGNEFVEGIWDKKK